MNWYWFHVLGLADLVVMVPRASMVAARGSDAFWIHDFSLQVREHDKIWAWMQEVSRWLCKLM